MIFSCSISVFWLIKRVAWLLLQLQVEQIESAKLMYILLSLEEDNVVFESKKRCLKVSEFWQVVALINDDLLGFVTRFKIVEFKSFNPLLSILCVSFKCLDDWNTSVTGFNNFD